MDVDLHAEQGVDQRHGVSAGRLDGLGHRDDVRDIRRELEDDGLLGMRLGRADDGRSRLRVGAEDDASFLDIWARDVELDGGDARHIEEAGELAVVLGRAA